MPLLKFPRPPLLLHPVVIALLTWSTVSLLYIMHLSDLLLYSTEDVLRTSAIIVGPVLAVSLIYWIVHTRFRGFAAKSFFCEEISADLLAKRLHQAMILWMVFAGIETIISGGVPLVWILLNNGRSYFEYGVPSIHGIVQALLMVTAVGYLALYLLTGQKRFLRFPIFAALWSLVEVSRGTLMVLMLEYGIVLLRLRPVRTATLLRLAGGIVGLLLLFGYIGDARTGAEEFKALARPTESYPDWAPSGMLWAYIYITTPLNNLMHTMHLRAPTYNPLFPATAATLFPTVIRTRIYGDLEGVIDIEGGELVIPQLTVSTAYIGPFQDMGALGMVGFSALTALLCEMYWHRHGLWNTFLFSVFAQALILTLFYNLLLSLPILVQLPWFYWICKPQRVAAPALAQRVVAI